MSLDGPANSPSVRNAGGQWFFRVEVLACRGGGRGDHGMPVVRRGIHHGINVLAGEDVAEVPIEIAIRQFGQIPGGPAVVNVDITDCHHLHAFIIEEGLQVSRAHAADADAGEPDFGIRSHRSIQSKDSPWQDQWGAKGGSGGGKEAAAANGFAHGMRR